MGGGGGGSRETGNELCNIAQYFAIEKATEAGATKEGDGNRGYKVREVGNLDPPLPPTGLWATFVHSLAWSNLQLVRNLVFIFVQSCKCKDT